MNDKVLVNEPQLRLTYDSCSRKGAEKSHENPKIDVISLFSGCGGMDLGFYNSGFNIKWANDIDKMACVTYEKNIGKHIVHGDITEIDYNKIPNADLILGGFPCQDFSMIWKRGGIETDRGNLYQNFVDSIFKESFNVYCRKCKRTTHC